jgi:hypothetical protein
MLLQRSRSFARVHRSRTAASVADFSLSGSRQHERPLATGVRPAGRESVVEEVAYSNNQLPTSRWACLEWQFEDQPDRVTTWISQTRRAALQGHEQRHHSVVSTSSGSVFTTGTRKRAFDIYYDDLVLDVKRVGCLD